MKVEAAFLDGGFNRFYHSVEIEAPAKSSVEIEAIAKFPFVQRGGEYHIWPGKIHDTGNAPWVVKDQRAFFRVNLNGNTF